MPWTAAARSRGQAGGYPGTAEIRVKAAVSRSDGGPATRLKSGGRVPAMPPGLGAEIKAQSRKLPVPSPGACPPRYGMAVLIETGAVLRGVVTSHGLCRPHRLSAVQAEHLGAGTARGVLA